MMENKKVHFINYLLKLGVYTKAIEKAFDVYFNELCSSNQKINLFSRKMNSEEIWTVHFMDSVSILEVFSDFNNKTVLDFGTGGGFPGVPIKILYPDCDMTFLDSTKKKIETLNNIITEINLHKVTFLSNRLESKEMDIFHSFFDIILCRGVKITQELSQNLLKLLNKSGKIFLYKAVNLDDVELFKKFTTHTLDLKYLGERRIIEVNYV